MRGESPLFFAARRDNIPTVRLLLARGARIDQRSYQQETALLWITQESESMFRFLVSQGADYTIHNRNKVTALHRAAEGYQVQTVRFLLQKGVPVDPRDDHRQTPLIIAAGNGCEEIVDMLLRRGADVNAQNEDGHSALAYALAAGETATVRRLLRSGADVHPLQVENALLAARANGYLPAYRLVQEARRKKK